MAMKKYRRALRFGPYDQYEIFYEHIAYLMYHFRHHASPERWECSECQRFTQIYMWAMQAFISVTYVV